MDAIRNLIIGLVFFYILAIIAGAKPDLSNLTEVSEPTINTTEEESTW